MIYNKDGLVIIQFSAEMKLMKNMFQNIKYFINVQIQKRFY